MLVRLAHIFGVSESLQLSAPVTVDLTQLFDRSFVRVRSAVELTMTGNQPVADLRRLQWRTDTDTVTADSSSSADTETETETDATEKEAVKKDTVRFLLDQLCCMHVYMIDDERAACN